MTLDEALDTYWAAAYAEGQRGATHDTPEGLAQTALNAVRSCLRLQVDAAIAAERERMAIAWDGCVHEAPGGDVDVGASIRAGHLVSVRDAL